MTHPTQKTDCRSVRTQLGDAIDRRLGRTDMNRFRQHLLACPSCRAEHDRLERLKIATSGLVDEPVSEDFRERLLARIEAGEGARSDALQHPAPLARIKFFVSGAATAAALLVSFWLVFDRLSEDDSSVNDLVTANMPSIPQVTSASAMPLPVAMDPNRLSLDAVQKSQELYLGLRDQAERFVDQPLRKRAMNDLVAQSRNFIQSVRVLNAFDGTLLDLPQDLRATFVEAERTAQSILAEARRDDSSYDDMKPYVETLTRLPAPRGGATTIRIRLQSRGPIDLVRVFANRMKGDAEIRDLMEFVEQHLLKGGVFPSDSIEFFGQPTFQIRLRQR